MKEGLGAEERLFRKSDKPCEDMSCKWHYKKSPSHNDFSPTDATGKWCIFVSTADVDEERSKISDAVENDQLMCAKVSTALRSIGRDGHVICVTHMTGPIGRTSCAPAKRCSRWASRRSSASNARLILETGFTALASGTCVRSQPQQSNR